MAEEQLLAGELDCIDECEEEQNGSAKGEMEATNENQEESEEKTVEKKRLFDGDRFSFTGRCDICNAGTFDDRDHIEFLIERCCATSRSYYYRAAIGKHWPDYQGLLISMQPYCVECKKHFWGFPDFTRHVYTMAVHGVEDQRLLEEHDTDGKKEEKKDSPKKAEPARKPESAATKETPATKGNEKKSSANEEAMKKSAKNRSRLKRRRQVRVTAIENELQRRLKRAEEIAAFLPEEEIPNEEQREKNRMTHTPLLETLTKLIQMGDTKEPEKETIELLNEVVCRQSPRWFEASYRLGYYDTLPQNISSSVIMNDISSGKVSVATLEARWRWARGDMNEDTYLELTGKLNENSQLSTADRERSLRRIAENGDLWKNDECSPSGETFTCLVCDRKGRSLRIHLDEALWLTTVSSPIDKSSNDIPDCPISVEASLAEMRNNPVMAHVYYYLGEESARRLIEELSLKSKRVLRCPACSFHYRSLKCCLPDLFSHVQNSGFMKLEGDFKDAHQSVALRISAILAEARGGFRATASIVDELIDYLSCDEGGLHFQKRGAVTVESLKSNPRIMGKIRQAVTRKLDEEASKKSSDAKVVKTQTQKAANPSQRSATQQQKAAPVKKPVPNRNVQSRDRMRGVVQTIQMKNKKPMQVPSRRGGYRSNGAGGLGLVGNLMGTHLPTNIRSGPAARSGSSGGMFGGRSQRETMQVGVYCELCSKEFYGYSFNEANRQLHTHLMDALFRSRREPGKTQMATQHLKCFSHNLVYNTVSFCPTCQMTRSSLDAILHHITQLASSNELTAVQHMNVANDLVSQFIECMNGTMSLNDLSIFVQRRFIR